MFDKYKCIAQCLSTQYYTDTKGSTHTKQLACGTKAKEFSSWKFWTGKPQPHKNYDFCWYVIPEMMIGVPSYDHEQCVAYCIDELRDNGFLIRYTHPNLLLISWQHWIPSYVRNEFKKKTGINIDGRGNKIVNKNKDENKLVLSKNNNNNNFKNINTYKPSGNLIYNNEIFKNIHNKSKSIE
mgnify:CR=1 FL=1